MADGTWYATSADDGQRGGPQDAHFHHQPQECNETSTEWICRWTSGEGKEIRCPRPPVSDPVAWRVDSDGEGHSTFTVPGAIETTPPPTPAPTPGSAPRPQGKGGRGGCALFFVAAATALAWAMA
jgi:hypothetical protein